MKIPVIPYSGVSRLSPGRIALGYAVIALLWIAFSDAIVTHFKLHPALMTIKGGIFVLVTASLLYFTIRRLVQAVQLTSGELRQSETYLAEAQKLSHTGSWAFDVASNGYVYVSEEFLRIFGLDPQEGLPTREMVFRRIHPEDSERANQAIEKSLDEKVETGDDFRVVLPEGTVRHVHVIRHPVLNNSGEVVQWVGTAIDITERKRAEEEVRNTAAQWQATFDAVQDLVLLLDQDFRILRANHAAAEFVGLPFDKIVGGHCYDLIHGASTSPAECPLAKMRQSRRHEEAEVLARKGGPWLLVSVDPLFDPSGELTQVVHVARDITDRKLAEEALALRSFALDNAHDAVLLIDEQARFVYVNEGCFRALGHTREELLGMGVPDIDPDFPAERWPDHWQTLKAQHSLHFESRLRAKDGRLFPVEISAKYLEYGGRGFNLAVARDITERKRSEEALRHSEAYLAEAQRLSHTGSFAFDVASNKYVNISEECLRIFELNAQETLPSREAVSRLIHPEDWDRVQGDFDRLLREKTDTASEFRIVLPSGAAKHVQVIRHPVLNGAGEVVTIVGTAMDITERKRAEEALSRSESYLAEAQRLSHTGTWAFDVASGNYVYFSEEYIRISGFDPQQGLPAKDQPLQQIHPDDVGAFWQAYQELIDEKVDSEGEYRIVLPDGTVKYLHAIRHPVLNANGELVEVVGTTIDITERKQAEEALRESETRFRTFVDHAGDALFVQDVEQGTIVDVNRSACESLGYTRQELIGNTPLAFHLDSYQAEMESVAERTVAGETVFDTHWHRRKDGSTFPVEVHTSLVSHGGRRFLLKVARDISDRVRAEEQRDQLRQLEAELAHLDRLTMLGELTASIAHEVNQPLSGVVSNGSACLRWLAGDVPDLEEAREAARRIVRDGKRAGEVIARIRALTKKASTPREKLDLNETLRQVLALVGDEAKRKSVNIRTRFASDLCPVSGDQVQLQQVVLNLAMNAIDAMSSIGERARELVITTRNIDAEQVQVTVEDSGVGLDTNTLQKIFEPFYTTKPTGMGMGLSISRSIVQSHGGQLWAAAKDGAGTIFYFTLPKYHQEKSNAAVSGV